MLDFNSVPPQAFPVGGDLNAQRDAIRADLLARLESVLMTLLPAGKKRGQKYLVGLHPDFVRFVARKAGYLADEKAHWQKVPIKVPVLPVPTEPVVSASSAPVHSITCHAHNHPPQGGLIHA